MKTTLSVSMKNKLKIFKSNLPYPIEKSFFIWNLKEDGID
jgi:hypothetical protein